MKPSGAAPFGRGTDTALTQVVLVQHFDEELTRLFPDQ